MESHRQLHSAKMVRTSYNRESARCVFTAGECGFNVRERCDTLNRAPWQSPEKAQGTEAGRDEVRCSHSSN